MIGLESASDAQVWQYARDNGFVIVSRDSDFHERSLVHGHPPQVVWLKIPNRSKTVVLNLLIEAREAIEQAMAQPDMACLELTLGK